MRFRSPDPVLSIVLAALAFAAACDATPERIASDAGHHADASQLADASAPADAASDSDDAATASDGGALPDAGGAPCANHVTFTSVQTEVFVGCSGHRLSRCHTVDPFDGSLDLTTTGAYADLVNRPSVKSPLPRVVPGDVEGSFLWRKLVDELPLDMSQGDPMPKGEAIRWIELPADQIDRVRCWIQEGAPND